MDKKEKNKHIVKSELTIDKIYSKTFPLFLEKNFEQVTVTDIEHATGLSRGTIFYHTHNKETLYRKVIDKFILDAQNSHVRLNLIIHSGDCNLMQFINYYLEYVDDKLNYLYSFFEGEHEFSKLDKSYLSLMLQTDVYYPGFDKEIIKIFDLEVTLWKIALQNAIALGEIKSEININAVALQFRYIFLGLSFDTSFRKGQDIELLKDLYYNLYDSLKI